LLSLSLVFQSVSPIFAGQSYKSGIYDELLNDNQSRLVVESDGHKDENSVVIAVANNKNPSSKHGIKLRVRTLKKLGKNGYYYNVSRNIVSWSKY